MFEYEEMWEMWLDDESPAKLENEAKRFMVLYPLNLLASHVVGLVYDQKSHLCVLCPDLYDMERIHTWRRMLFYNTMLDETLDALNKLVEAIEARLPQGSSLNDDSIGYGLVDADVLQLHNIPPGFAREFLACARSPRFEYIAPGLEVITTSTFPSQPFIPNPDTTVGKDTIPAILLFCSKLNYNNSDDLLEPGRTGPFGYRQRQIASFPAGLYLLPARGYMSDNACKFIFPFSIGGNGYARRTDGSLYGENRPKDSFEDLYSSGYHPLETTYTQNLASVLRNWLGMVERGDWKIDENGVAGGLEIWKEADTEERWEKYVIKRDFVERVSERWRGDGKEAPG